APPSATYTLSLHDALPISPPTWEATLLYRVDVLWPKNTTAARQTMAISPTRKAYSTRLAPRSLLKRHLHVRYLATAKRSISVVRSEEHTSELQSRENLVCR